MQSHLHESIEILESRIAPAGLVTVAYDAATGILTLGGDAEANDVEVFGTGAGTFRVEGISTEIDAAGVFTKDLAGKLTSVVINGLAGADEFDLENLPTFKTLTFNGGDGVDSLNTINLTTTGGVTLDFGINGGGANFGGRTTIGGDVTAAAGDSGVVGFTGTAATVRGAVVFNGGAGVDNLDFFANVNVIGKGVKFTGAGGSNTVNFFGVSNTVGKGATGNALEFTGTDGSDRLEIGGTATTLKGNLLFETGAGQDLMTLAPGVLKIDGALTANTGGDADNLQLSPGTGTIKGAVNIDLGDGDTNVASFTPGVSLTLGGALTVKGGSQADIFTIENAAVVTVKGAAVIDVGDGADLATNQVELDSSILSFGSTLTIKGAATSALNLSSDATLFTVRGLFDVQAGDGTNLVQVDASEASFGALSVKTGAGEDTVSFFGEKLKAGGAVNVETTGASDSVSFGYGVVDIKGAVSIKTGDAADSASFVADGSVKGDLTIDLGAAAVGASFADIASNSRLVGNLKLGGKLTLTSTASGVATTDNVSLTDVTVAKAVLMNLGDAASTVAIDNLVARDTFTLNTGAGADVVDIEQGARFGPSLFAKVVAINLGLDDDTFRAGVSSAPGSGSFARFLGNVTVDGGDGLDDASNDFLNVATNFFAPSATKIRSNFEGPFIV